MNSSGAFNYIPDELLQGKYKKPETVSINLNIKIDKPKEEMDDNSNLPLYKNKINPSMFASPISLKPAVFNNKAFNSKPQQVVADTVKYSKDEILFCSKSVMANMQIKKIKKRDLDLMHVGSLFESNITTNIKIENDTPKIFAKGEVVKKTAWGKYYKLVSKMHKLNNEFKIPQFTADEIESLWFNTKEKALTQKEADLIFNIKTIFEGSQIIKKGVHS